MLLANGPVIIILILGGEDGLIFGAGAGQLAALAYIGLSPVLAGWRSDAGCEVMVLPGLLSGRRTHLACIVFSPIDWPEEQVSWRLCASGDVHRWSPAGLVDFTNS